eukprot:6207104-Pleurochrysis_carterae.AAC.2
MSQSENTTKSGSQTSWPQAMLRSYQLAASNAQELFVNVERCVGNSFGNDVKRAHRLHVRLYA